MSWSFADARRAAAAVHAAELGRRAVQTVRPRGVLGVVRARAPLPLLLYVAARDGLVVGRPDGGFAVLQPPLTDRPDRIGGYRQRTLRALDRHWDIVVFAGPAVVSLGAAVAAALGLSALLAAVVFVLLGVAWIAALMTAMVAFALLGWVRQMGARSTAPHSRHAEFLPGHLWSIPLLHQPGPDRVDDLVWAIKERLRRLVIARAEGFVHGQADIEGRVTGALVLLTHGVTTRPARSALMASVHASASQPDDSGLIVLDPPSRMRNPPEWRVSGGSFLILYFFALAVVVAVCAELVAAAEADACRTSCAGRPATYDTALQWLLHRVLFSDGTFSPATTWTTFIGLLVSVAAVMVLPVAIVACRQELLCNRQTAESSRELMNTMNGATVLILVVADVERDAVLAAVRKLTGKEPALDHGPRTAFRLGSVGDVRILLAQAGEQGTASAAGMLVSAVKLVEYLDPDYVILTGICYGLRPDEGQRIGDIVVGRRVQGVDHRKVTETDIINRGVNVPCSPQLLTRFQSAQVSWTASQVHVGTILSSNALVNSRALVDELRCQFPDAIAGEMEGVGLSEATMDDFKPNWIVVKAISDWGYDKTDDLQAEAAGNVADFVVRVLGSGALARLRADRGAGAGPLSTRRVLFDRDRPRRGVADH